jgi:K+/H+ antiporter YhaU regulatory subunit KhtT
VIQDGKLHPNPNADYQFAVGDLVGVIGNFEQIAAFQAMATPVEIQTNDAEIKQ